MLKVEAVLTDETKLEVEQIVTGVIEGAEISWAQAKMIGGGWFASVTTSNLVKAEEERRIKEEIRKLTGPTIILAFKIKVPVQPSAEV